METIKQLDDTYVAHTYGRFPVELVSGSGSILKDVNGKEFIDMGSGIAVSSFGVCDSLWADAVSKQAHTLTHTSNLYYTSPCAVLARELCSRTGFKKVFYGNSGAEANECAIKAARKYASEKKGNEYYTIVTLENSFHGRTLTTLAATGQDHFHELFQPLTPGFVSVAANDIGSLKEAAVKHKAAAVMIELIQGEGGVNVLNESYVKALSEFCNDEDILLIIDEVQTGNGRTGELYCYMNYDIMPDIITTAKGLGGGLPIGVCLLGEKVENIFSPGDHGSTFGGNPIACAGALTVIERLTPEFLAEVKKKGEYLKQSFTGAKGVTAFAGMGLMAGIKPSGDLGTIMNQLIDKGVLALTAKDKLRLLPALNIPMDVLQKAVDTILTVLEANA